MISLIRRIIKAIQHQMDIDLYKAGWVDCPHDAVNPCEACETQAWADRW